MRPRVSRFLKHSTDRSRPAEGSLERLPATHRHPNPRLSSEPPLRPAQGVRRHVGRRFFDGSKKRSENIIAPELPVCTTTILLISPDPHTRRFWSQRSPANATGLSGSRSIPTRPLRVLNDTRFFTREAESVESIDDASGYTSSDLAGHYDAVCGYFPSCGAASTAGSCGGDDG